MVFSSPRELSEVGTTNKMTDYAPGLPFLLGEVARSYGTSRNRRWDAGGSTWPISRRRKWCERFAWRVLSLYVDKRGYADSGEACANCERCSAPSWSFPIRRAVAFSLTPAAKELHSSMDEKAWTLEKSRLLNRPCVLCQDGFHRWAPTTPPEPWRAMHRANMRLINPGDRNCRVVLSFLWECARGQENEIHLTCETLGLDRRETPPTERTRFELDLDLPPGEHVLRFDTTPKPIGLSRMFTAWTATDVRPDPRD